MPERKKHTKAWSWMVAVVATAAFLTAWYMHWASYYNSHTTANVARHHAELRREWATRRATVVSVSAIRNGKITNYDGVENDTASLYRLATLKYWGAEGSLRKAIVFLPPTFQKGDKEWTVVNRQNGRAWFQDDLQNTGNNPRTHVGDQDDVLSILMMVFGFIPAIFVLLVSYVVSELVLQNRFMQLVLDLLGALKKRTFRILAWVPAEVRLRWEFHRRKKQSRPVSYAYKSLRRMQQDLKRMDDTPAVVEARRRANKLLTDIIEQDNHRLDEIQAVMKGIREDVDLKNEARQEVEEELG